MVGIVSYGAYIPYHRLPLSVIGKAWGRAGGRGEKAVAYYDEDILSMCVAAGMDCLKGLDAKTVEGLFLGTTTSPYKERLNANIVATALDLGPAVRNADFCNCLRAGTTALLSAADAVKSGALKKVMVTASDMRLGAPSGENEQNFGDGAAALLLGNENVIAEIESSYSISEDLNDYWRTWDDVFVRSWEDRFGTTEGYEKFPVDAALGSLNKLSLTTKDITRACLYAPNLRRHSDLTKRLKLDPAQVQEPLLDSVGNTGSAQSLMILVGALETSKPGDRILLIGYGNGADAVVLRVTPAIEKIKDRRGIKRHLQIRRTLDSYEKYLRWRSLVATEPAARPLKELVSMASLWREHRSAMPLYGVKCKKCGTPQMYLSSSSTRAHVCLECHTKDQFEPYRFADKKGNATSFSHDYLAYSSDPPSTLTIVDFEGGGRGVFQMTDRDPVECKVGMGIEMTFRRLFFDRGVYNYFWKCKPLRD